MNSIITKAFFFFLLICVGNLLKAVGVLKKEEHKVLGKIVFNLTLPATLISTFKEFKFDSSLLFYIVLGIILNTFMVYLGYIVGRKKTPEIRGMYMLCCSGYNISLFTLPLVSNFLGNESIIVVAMFDVGNLIMGLGGVCVLASLLMKGNTDVTKGYVVKSLLTNPPFIVYISMLWLAITNIELPNIAYQFTDLASTANTVLVMILIGLMFDMKTFKEIKNVFQVLLVRYTVAAILLISIITLSPLLKEYNFALCIVVLAPVTTISPMLCERMGYKYDIASTLFSCGIPISLVCITGLLVFMNI